MMSRSWPLNLCPGVSLSILLRTQEYRCCMRIEVRSFSCFLINSRWIIGQQLAVCSPTDSVTHFLPLHFLFYLSVWSLAIISPLFVFYSIFLILFFLCSHTNEIVTDASKNYFTFSFIFCATTSFLLLKSVCLPSSFTLTLLISFPSLHFLFFCPPSCSLLFSLLLCFQPGDWQTAVPSAIGSHFELNWTKTPHQFSFIFFFFFCCNSLHSSPFCSMLYDCAPQLSDLVTGSEY